MRQQNSKSKHNETRFNKHTSRKSFAKQNLFNQRTKGDAGSVPIAIGISELYGVATKVLKQAVKRNLQRFPDDFMFELSP